MDALPMRYSYRRLGKIGKSVIGRKHVFVLYAQLLNVQRMDASNIIGVNYCCQ